MIRRLFLAALFAGCLTGLIISAIHHVTTVPLILRAEIYETADRSQAAGSRIAPLRLPGLPGQGAALYQVHDNTPATDGSDWAPLGWERVFYTTATTILLSIGFALLLIVGMILRGERPDVRRGLLWGAGGFAAFTLAPALGLPPELPGLAAADLASRQTWWLAAAVSAIIGLWLLVFRRAMRWKILGAVILAAPHVVGAPQPPLEAGGPTPAELAAQFAATSIVISALFWVLLGGFAGYFFGRSLPDADVKT